MLQRSFFIKKNSIYYTPIILLAFFPYISIYPMHTDTQPLSIATIALAIFILLCAPGGIKFPKRLEPLFIPLFFAILFFLWSIISFDGARSLAGYITIILVPFIFSKILRDNRELFVKCLKFTIIVYMLVGLIQLLYDNSFLSFLMYRMSTTSSRGVCSLTTEPTYYGIVCLFFIMIVLALNIERKRAYVMLLVFQIIFLAQSSMVILFLLILAIYYIIFNINFKVIFSFLVIMIISTFLLSHIDIENYHSRFLHLLYEAINHPSSIIIRDASINDRVSSIYFSLKGFFSNNMLPNGFGNYISYLNTELPQQTTFWWVSLSNRIMSYYGSILFEMGVIGSLIPIVYSYILLHAYRYQLRIFLMYFFFLNTILFGAVPLTFPLVGIYIASLIYKADNETPDNPQ